MLTNQDVLIRLVLALVASGLVGLERETTKHPAGLRTHMLVCVASTLITLTSIQMYPEDPTRIASGIITGIGFLGAGTIFRDRNHVRGLTTAASLWSVAGVGLALGAGAYFISIMATASMLFILRLGVMNSRKKTRN